MGDEKKMENKVALYKIYLLTNINTGKIYIGQTTDPYKKRMGTNGNGYIGCTRLYNSIKKHGIEKFEYTTLEICYDKLEADKLEDDYILKYDALNRSVGYNLKRGGSGGKLTDEVKQKISQSHMGIKPNEETKQKMSLAKMGKQTWMKGKSHSEESKMKISENLTGRVSGFLGKTHSEEAREKISEANTGKIVSEETKQKQSERMMGNTFMVGRVHTEETKQKMSKSHKGINTWMKGRKASQESKNKMRTLTSEQEEQIRTEYVPKVVKQKDLAVKYNVTQQTISRILKRKD